MQLRLLFILFFYSHAVVSMLSTYHRMDIRNRQINKLQTSNLIVMNLFSFLVQYDECVIPKPYQIEQ